MAIEGHTGLKLIFDVLYVPEINQNLLSVAQLWKKGKMLFEDKSCIIKDIESRDVFKVQMKDKSFALDLIQEKQAAVHKENNNEMLWHKRLGYYHHAAVYPLNRLPTKALYKKTHFEAWYGYKPYFVDLKTFGCLCFSYIHQVKRDKLDKKAEPGIFVGYSSSSKAYRIYLPESNKVIISRDVQFHKSNSWS